MIRKLLATTALASIIATGAYARGTTAPANETPAATSSETAAPAATDAAVPAAAEFDYVQSAGTDQYLESSLVGQTVYGQGSEETSGEIENYLIGFDGKVAAVIVGTGNILDEAKVVAVPVDKITWSMGENSEPRATLTATRDELMSAPAFTETTAVDATESGAAAPAAPATTDTAANTGAAAPAAGTAAPAAGGTAAKPLDSAAISTDSAYPATVGGDQYLSQNIIGGSVYAGPSAEAESIGSVNDLVLSKDGDVVAAVIGVGGFLGIGEKNVGVPFGELKMTRDDNNEPRAILAATKEQLTAAPTFEGEPADAAESASTGASTETAVSSSTTPAETTGASAGAAAGAAVGSAADDTADAVNKTADATTNATNETTDTADNAAATGTTAATGAAGTAEETTASTGGSDRAGMTPVTGPELSADKLVGTTVYGPNDASIGSVGDIALSQDGKVDAVIVDVGGFLGIGQKQVAVAMDNLQFMKDSGGSMYLYTQFTEDQLKNAPEYNSDTYAQNRDTMRLSPGEAAPAAGATDGAATPAPAQ